MKSKYSLALISVIIILSLLCTFAAMPAVAVSETKEKALSKIDDFLSKKISDAKANDKIPVYIWYEDVNQDEIDTLTEQELGFKEEDISETYEMPSTELIGRLLEGEADADEEIKAYYARTKSHRDRERRKVNEYINTRREFSREKYNRKAKELNRELSIPDNDIIFQSSYAPMIIAELTADQISSICYDSRVQIITYYEEPEYIDESLETAVVNTNVSKVADSKGLGLSGAGVKVGIIENNAAIVAQTSDSKYFIVPQNENPTIRTTSNGVSLKDYGNVVIVGNTEIVNNYTHADIMAHTIRTVAPDVTFYSSNHSFTNMEAMITDGVQIISISNGVQTIDGDLNYTYYVQERWFDHLVAQHGLTVIKSAGNNGDSTAVTDVPSDNENTYKFLGHRITTPGLAYNVITVGSYADTTVEVFDQNGDFKYAYPPNTLMKKSSYQNKLLKNNQVVSGCEKPDVLGPASYDGYGTSNSAAFLNGMMALMLELKPSLAAYPQALKAILLASCHRKVSHMSDSGTTETIEEGITDRQGAGVPDAWIMASIISQGTYGVGRLSSTSNLGKRRFVMPPNNAENMNVSLTWLRECTIPDGYSHSYSVNTNEGDYVNLNLNVLRNDGSNWSSSLANSSTEMVYLELDDVNWNYEIQIQDASLYNGIVRYGYAYSTDNPYVTPITEEGVYYIRNYYTDKYLTLDTNTSEAVMADYTGASNQHWVLKGSADDYEIYPAHSSPVQKINFGSQVGTNPFYKSVLGTGDLNLSVKSWESHPIVNGTALEPDAYVFTSTSGGNNNIMSYTYTTGVFVRSASESIVNLYRMWVLEDINYRGGDVNMDGQFTETDVAILQNYLNHAATLSNAQSLIADANYDGVITVKDVSAVQKLIPTN